jgi:hypothetical protein
VCSSDLYNPIPSVQKFIDIGFKKSEKESEVESFEIQCKLGDILETPVSYQTIEMMKQYKIEVPTEKLIEALLSLNEKLSLATDSLGMKWKSILNKAFLIETADATKLLEGVFGDDRYMLAQLIKAIEKR